VESPDDTNLLFLAQAMQGDGIPKPVLDADEQLFWSPARLAYMWENGIGMCQAPGVYSTPKKKGTGEKKSVDFATVTVRWLLTPGESMPADRPSFVCYPQPVDTPPDETFHVLYGIPSNHIIIPLRRKQDYQYADWILSTYLANAAVLIFSSPTGILSSIEGCSFGAALLDACKSLCSGTPYCGFPVTGCINTEDDQFANGPAGTPAQPGDLNDKCRGARKAGLRLRKNW
jgi:hypothetical protein